MPDSLIRDQLIEAVSVLINLTPVAIKNRLATNKQSVQSSRRIANDQKVRHTPIRYAITLLLHDTSFVQFIDNPEQIALSNLRGVDLLTTLIETIEENPHINGASLLERWRNTDFEASLIRLMKWRPDTEDNKVLAQEFQDCLRQIRKKANEKKLEALIHKERTAGLTPRERQDFLALLHGS